VHSSCSVPKGVCRMGECGIKREEAKIPALLFLLKFSAAPKKEKLEHFFLTIYNLLEVFHIVDL